MDVTPSARRLTSSLRDIGYDFPAALADLVDNSVAAGATRVEIDVVFDGLRSHVVISDDGEGMTEARLCEAMRFGTRRTYEVGELGRYGLGLKTASLSQCRRLTVATRRAARRRRIAVRTLDLGHILRTDRWEIIEPPPSSRIDRYLDRLDDGPGTVVLWEMLDRLLPERRPEGGWARRRFRRLAEGARTYLGMVFHRFLEGDTARDRPLTIVVNGEKVRPWNPFAPTEENRIVLPPDRFEVPVGRSSGTVLLRRYILPPRSAFSSPEEFERMSGPEKWNRQQGLYIYRSDRLVRWGGWCGIRAIDEHTKLARASLDFGTDLDELFQINVAKMRVNLPGAIRTLIERPIHELCHRADAVYRRDASDGRRAEPASTDGAPPAPADLTEVGATILAAALAAGETAAMDRIASQLTSISPATAAALGWAPAQPPVSVG